MTPVHTMRVLLSAAANGLAAASASVAVKRTNPGVVVVRAVTSGAGSSRFAASLASLPWPPLRRGGGSALGHGWAGVVPPPPPPLSHRGLATASNAVGAEPPLLSNAASSSAATTTTTTRYWEQKKIDKDRRRELYVARQDRKVRLKVRRAGKPKDQKRNEFRSFFIRKKVDDEYMDRKARQANMNWQIQVAVLLERIPVVLPDKQDWEREYDKMKAHLNLFGKVYPKELVGNIDYDAIRPMTDEEVLAQLPFTPAPRETEADATGEVRTTNRKLKTNLYLVVQDGDDGVWQLPTVAIKNDDDGETLLAAAKRAMVEKVGKQVEFWCPSNCPWSVDLTAFSPEQQTKTGLYGTKTFFMKVQYDEGDVTEKEMTVQDFAWLDRGEIVARVRQQQGDHLSQFYHYML